MPDFTLLLQMIEFVLKDRTQLALVNIEHPSGSEVRTPAMQAGVASRKLTLRDVFVPQVVPAPFVLVGSRAEAYHECVETRKRAAKQHL